MIVIRPNWCYREFQSIATTRSLDDSDIFRFTTGPAKQEHQSCLFDLVCVQHGIDFIINLPKKSHGSWIWWCQWPKEIISRKMSQNLDADEWTLCIFFRFFTFSCCVLGTNGTNGTRQTYSENTSTLWLFEIAMDNCRFIDELWWFTYEIIKRCDFPWQTIK